MFILQVTSSGSPETPSQAHDLDEFTRKITADDARVLVDLLKLAVATRAGVGGRMALSHVLTALGQTWPSVAEMLLELCVTELEDVAADTESGRNAAQPVIQESPHPYVDDTALTGSVRIQGECLAIQMRISHMHETHTLPSLCLQMA